jgi:hypothetical protein
MKPVQPMQPSLPSRPPKEHHRPRTRTPRRDDEDAPPRDPDTPRKHIDEYA